MTNVGDALTIVKAIFKGAILYTSVLHFQEVTGQRLYNMLVKPFFAYSFDSFVHIFENIKLSSFLRMMAVTLSISSSIFFS